MRNGEIQVRRSKQAGVRGLAQNLAKQEGKTRGRGIQGRAWFEKGGVVKRRGGACPKGWGV